MSITISGGGAPGITVETDPTALKLTGGTITTNSSSVAALRIVQQGTGNVLEIFDQNGDPSPLIVDGEGNVAIGTNIVSWRKLNVGGAVGVAGSLDATGGINGGWLTVGNVDFKTVVANYLFSGTTVAQSSNSITASVYYYDGMNYFYSGQYDSNYQEISYPTVGTSTSDIAWNGSAFAVVGGTTSYINQGDVVGSFYSSSVGSVTIFSNGSGGLEYSPPSQ